MERAGERMGQWFGGGEDRARQGDQRGRGPKGYRRSDERIREDVHDRLTDDPFLDATEIVVMVESGEVTLTGTVNSREDRRRAEDIVERLSGVDHVQNNLRVQPQGQQAGQQPGQTTASSTAGKPASGATSSGGTGASSSGGPRST
jgi:hypothetical protein